MEKIYLFGEPKPRSRPEIVDTYIDTFTSRDTTYAASIAEQIIHPDRPLAATQVLIPVAAHQEAAQIPVALEQYAGQQTSDPFTVILSLNSPLSEQQNPQITQTLQAIERARTDHPELDVRTAISFYEQPVIGMIRRDLWNGALLASREQGYYNNETDEVIGINHDIDLVSMSPRYIQRIQTAYKNRQRNFESCHITAPLSMARTGIRHALDPAYPNISKGILWSDFTNRQLHSSYEAGLVFPLSFYAQRGGFNSTDSTYETHHLSRTIKRVQHIPGTAMQTSPRRYLDRLQYGYDKVWTNETFGASDTCRDTAKNRDISFHKLEEIMDQNEKLTETIFAMSAIAANTYATKQEEMMLIENTVVAYERKIRADLDKYSHAKIHLADAVLSRVIESPLLARKARALHDDKIFHQELEYLFLG